jgi:fatty acid/phospholipid biosynthesis enzyme
VRLALDGMGGETAPAAVVEGALLFAAAAVAHGRSSGRAVASALPVARRTVEVDLGGGLAAAIAR